MRGCVRGPERAFELDLVFNSLGVLEVFLTFQWLLGDRSPTLVQAIAFEALSGRWRRG